jgi:hypothetical protein
MLDGPKVGLIVLAVALALVGLGIYLYERRNSRHRRDREPQRLPLFGTEQLAIRSADGDDYDVAPSPARPITRARPAEPQLPAPRGAPDGAPSGRNGRTPLSRPEPARSPYAPPAPTAEYPAPVARPTAPTPRPTAPAAAPAAQSGNGLAELAMIDGETLRFSVPSDGPMELLPGRLEIVAGPESGREIRFVRAQGEVDVEVTFGRSEGPPNRHVQILARTVSRRHAIMTLIDDHWQLTNLSSTNPLVLNGRVLAGNEVAPLLVEGDRIEMGEVAFVFHDG